MAAHDTVPALLHAASHLMAPPIAQLEQVLQGDLEVRLSPAVQEVVLCVAMLTKKLTDQFRRKTHVGCVDRAVQTIVRCLTGGALLDAEQCRILGRAVRLADHQVSLIALDVNDLVETEFELIRADNYDRAAQRDAHTVLDPDFAVRWTSNNDAVGPHRRDGAPGGVRETIIPSKHFKAVPRWSFRHVGSPTPVRS